MLNVPQAGTWQSGAEMTAESRQGSEAYRLGLSLGLVLLPVVADVNNQLNKGAGAVGGTKLRYLLLLIPVASMLLIRLRQPSSFIRRTELSDRFLLFLAMYGLAGSIYGSLVLHTRSTALPIFLPMIVGLLHMGVRDRLSPREAKRLLRWVAFVGLIYIGLNALANSGLAPPLAASRSYRNAKVLFVVVGVVAAILARQRLRAIVLTALGAYIFFTYPSATTVVVAGVALITLFATRPKASSVRPYVVGVAALVIATVGLANIDRTIGLTNTYFLFVGKQNNNDTRVALYQAGVDQIRSSPFFGDAFSGELSVTIRLPSGQLFTAPFHDDYILLAAAGGLISLLLFLGWAISTEIGALRRYQYLVASGGGENAALLRTALVGFNAWLAAALFNPLFQGLGRSITLFALYGLVKLAGTGEPGWSDAVPDRTTQGIEAKSLRAGTRSGSSGVFGIERR